MVEKGYKVRNSGKEKYHFSCIEKQVLHTHAFLLFLLRERLTCNKKKL